MLEDVLVEFELTCYFFFVGVATREKSQIFACQLFHVLVVVLLNDYLNQHIHLLGLYATYVANLEMKRFIIAKHASLMHTDIVQNWKIRQMCFSMPILLSLKTKII